MGEYKTPGVYIKEKNAFGNSVVEAETAIPAFIGYTEKALNGSDDLTNIPWKISSMTEFVKYFGGAPTPKLTAAIKDKNLQLTGLTPFRLYYQMVLFFANGGSTCYIVSVDPYKKKIENNGTEGGDKYCTTKISADSLISGIDKLALVQEVTMVVIPEAVCLSEADCTKVQQQMLMHCGGSMKNRFAILDVFCKEKRKEKLIEDFQTNIGTNFLSYGAVYYPWLKTSVLSERDVDGSLIHWEREEIVKCIDEGNDMDVAMKQLFYSAFRFVKLNLQESKEDGYNLVINGTPLAFDTTTADTFNIGALSVFDVKDESEDKSKAQEKVFTFNLEEKEAPVLYITLTKTTIEGDSEGNKKEIVQTIISKDKEKTDLITDLNTLKKHIEDEKVPTLLCETSSDSIFLFINIDDETSRRTLHQALLNCCFLYKQKIQDLINELNLLPPSAAMAGLYTMVDSTRGVWKAPANVSLNYVVSPAEDIDDDEQANLNAPMNGKAINVIRSFRGEGVKVWGARTLDGNSLDWRYINVRRTLIFLEESVRNAARAYVFEPNDAGTWINMKCMIENFLRSVWKRGGLAGATPEDAFEVHVGLGDTMTGEDILEGIMRITVLVAVTHPAEFIEITFQQQMQKS